MLSGAGYANYTTYTVYEVLNKDPVFLNRLRKRREI